MRDDQESKALAIENKRRAAKGLTPLASLVDSEEEEEAPADSVDTAAENALTQTDEEDAEASDVLLMETGRILVDAITLRPNTSVATRDADRDSPKSL